MVKKYDSTQKIEVAGLRVAMGLLFPLAGLLLAKLFLSGNVSDTPYASQTAVPLAVAGLIGWLLGLRWYGMDGMGLRGKRPLTSGIGFAFLGWLAFLALRFAFVRIVGFGPAGSTRAFAYLLLFEAFALQIWTFGLLFRAIADWKGPLTAAIGSGLVFGFIAAAFFQEAFVNTPFSTIYFLMWGILYGIIRLRTGSIIGVILVQALHSFSAWVVNVSPSPPDASQLQTLYLTATIAYMIIIWRLWPKETADYRV